MVILFLRIFVPFEECIQVRWSLFIDIINKSIRLWIALLHDLMIIPKQKLIPSMMLKNN